VVEKTEGLDEGISHIVETIHYSHISLVKYTGNTTRRASYSVEPRIHSVEQHLAIAQNRGKDTNCHVLYLLVILSNKSNIEPTQNQAELRNYLQMSF
jgi:hypothetical protein